MKNRNLRILFFFICVFVVVSLACGVFSQADPTATVQPEVQVEEPVQVEEVEDTTIVEAEPTLTHTPELIMPTLEEEPTQEPVQVEETVEETLPTAELIYFIEEFDRDPEWFFEIIKGSGGGDPDSVRYSFNFGRMIFDIPERYLYTYYIYEDATYDNVRLDINFENRGVNTQGVSLICQRSDEGWYELSIQSDGLWELYAVTEDYDLIAYGGSTFIRIGKEVNEYTLVCEGNKLSFFINGVEPSGSPHIDRKYALRWGIVGFGVASYQATPVKVEVDWFAITAP